jgi:hypothetical protein
MNTNPNIHSAAQALGRLGGLAKSEAKATAVRDNGKLGGRPLGKKDSKPRKRRITK